jgi:hypothetical protein
LLPAKVMSKQFGCCTFDLIVRAVCISTPAFQHKNRSTAVAGCCFRECVIIYILPLVSSQPRFLPPLELDHELGVGVVVGAA